MKFSIFSLSLSLLLCSTSAISNETKPSQVKKTFNSAGISNIFSGVNFHYLDKEDRIDIINSFLKRVQSDYSLLPIKEKRIGLNLSKMKADAIDIENNISSILLLAQDKNNQELREKVSFLQAKQNLEFFDRMAKLVAQFKDTHFALQTKIARPFVYLGMNFYRADGKVTVGSIENKVMGYSSKLAGYDFSVIKAGDEVVSIDGVGVEEKINELKPYINSSSEGYAEMMGIWSLTQREFRYPEKNYAIIKFKNAGTFKLPYFASLPPKTTPRVDANIYFKKIGIPTDLATVGLVYDKVTRTWSDENQTYTGYSTRNLYENLVDLKEYNDDNGAPAIRTGYFLKKGVAHGVLQLLTFSTVNVKNDQVTQPFISAIANFILELKTNDIDLIIDLRNNGGGQINYTSQLLSLIAKTSANYPGQTGGYRIVPTIREIFEADMFQLIPAEDLNADLSMDQYRDILGKTIDDNREYTPMFTHSSVTPSPLIGGYDKKIVALITPNCISACDITSFIFKSSERVTLIGSQSNGTGAGFINSKEVTTGWEDDLKIFNTSIPNLLFGLPGSKTDTETLIFEQNSVDRLDTENQPTIADVQYSTTRKDLLNKNIGWLEKAVEVLESK